MKYGITSKNAIYDEPKKLGVSLMKEQIDREKAAVKVYQELQRAKAKRKKILFIY